MGHGGTAVENKVEAAVQLTRQDTAHRSIPEYVCLAVRNRDAFAFGSFQKRGAPAPPRPMPQRHAPTHCSCIY